MIRTALLVGFAAALAPAAAPASDVWQSTGPDGGVAVCIAPSPSDSSLVFAGIAQGGIYRSADGGATWTAASTGLANLDVLSLAASPSDPQRLVAGTSAGGYLSVNGGSTWSPIPTLPGPTVSHIVFDPASSLIVYAAGAEGTLSKSADGGATWTAIGANAASRKPMTLAIDPSHSATIYVGTSDDGVYKSTDGGGTWAAQNSGLTNLHVSALVVDPTAASTVYAGTIDGGAFKSTDGGGTWSSFSFGLVGMDVAAMAADSFPTIYLANRSGMYAIAGGGLIWTPIAGTTFVNALAVGPGSPGRLFAGFGELPISGGNVFYSDGDRSQPRFGTGIRGVPIVSLAVDPFVPSHVLAISSGGTTYVSENAGSRWDQVQLIGPESLPASLAFDPDEQDVVYEGGATGVHKSSNGGETWTFAGSGLPDSPVRPVLPVPSATGIVLAGTAVGAYRTTDGGATWQVTTGGPAGSVWSFGAASGRLWAGAEDGVYRSTDQGATWSRAGNLSGPVRAVLDSSVASRVFAGTDDGVFVSSDGGATWTPAAGGLPAALAVRTLVEDTATAAVIVGAFPGVYESLDHGSSWNAVGSGLTNPYVQTLALASGGVLLAGARAGSIFRLTAAPPAVERGAVDRPPAPPATPRPLPARP